jgi:thiol-disulfide isomerase/thioredoxin
MRKPILIIVVAVASAGITQPQSGRRIATPASAPIAPIQPPTNPEPELKPTTAEVLPELPILTERLREREIKSLDNSTFRLSDFTGKVVVINIWASWCGPCRREVPEYEKVRKEYAGRAVEFIGLTAEDPRTAAARVNKFVREVNFGFRLGWADRELAHTLMNGKTAIPQTLVIDSDGRVIKHWSGYSAGRSGDRLRDTIEMASNEKTN